MSPLLQTLLLQWACAFLIASLLAAHGLRKKSLSHSGAAAAFLVGLLSWGSGVRFGATMILFYFSSSKLTKYKAHIKQQYEEDFKEGGQRDASQVLSCSAPAVAVGLVHFALGRDPAAPVDFASDSMGALMKCMILGFYACCCGDTWASEVGILDKNPRSCLVLPPFPRVPKGTNGGISLLGTLASLAGGIFIGIVYWLTSGCTGGPVQLLWQLLLGAFGGSGGSLIDSLMGATLQATYWDPGTQKVVSNLAAVEQGPYKAAELEHICGRSILSNHAVNLLSASLTGIIIGAVGWILC